MASNKKLNQGQQWIPTVQQAVEDSFDSRPAGMPSLSVIKGEAAKMGLPDSDAEAIYDAWLASGFRLKGGRKIRDWKAAMRTWKRYRAFPSQQGARPQMAIAKFPVHREYAIRYYEDHGEKYRCVRIGNYAYQKLLSTGGYWARMPIDTPERAHAVLEQIKEIYYRENP
jgi:hypothetical protein